MSKYKPGIDIDRRKKPDIWVRSLSLIGLIGWIFMLAALIIIGIAKPETATLFDRTLDITTRENWNYTLVSYIFYLMILGLILSIVGLFINKRRHRRKDDEYRISVILVGLISLMGIIYYLFVF